MTFLSELEAGNEFLFVAQVTAIDVSGFHLALFGPGAVQAAVATIDASGVMTGNLATTPNQIPVTVVTGFAPIAAGDVLASDRTGETMVARSAWITPQGESMWANTTDAKVAYSAVGWTVIGHVSL